MAGRLLAGASAETLAAGPRASLATARRANLDGLAASALIFLAAFLLFAVEPILGKLILPRFGGASSVWTACLLFFQSALVVGYLYAHMLARITGARLQVATHSLLLLASLAALPLSLPAATAAGDAPLADILGLLVRAVGLPFVLLASTGPLLQHWLAEGRGPAATAGRSPVRLYAVSNLGSLLALVSYPVLVEPALSIRLQTLEWTLGYGLFAAISIAAAWAARWRAAPERPAEARDAPPAPADCALWFLLSLAASALLLAMTSHITQDVAPVPLFWIIPLGLYLVSFIAVFGWPGLYRRVAWLPLCALALGGLMYATAVPPAVQNLPLVLGGYAAGFFVACLVLNGELESLRPAPGRLTGYYLTIAAGGAAGAVLVAAVAPALLPGPYDLPIALTAAGGVVIAAVWRAEPVRRAGLWRPALLAMASVSLAMAAAFVAWCDAEEARGAVTLARNFYGSLLVADEPDDVSGGVVRELTNGDIIHGAEYLSPADRTGLPISYYSRASGVALALQTLGRSGPLSVGVVGLGAGTLAAFARPGDRYTFYDINPLVARLARRDFAFLGDTRATWRIQLGDARLSLAREAGPRLDVLVIDAFAGDAIPTHLLTREAFALYWRRLKPDGVLIINTSNRYLDLAPLVAAEGREDGKDVRLVVNDADETTETYAACWVLITSRPGFFADPALRSAQVIPPRPGLRVWTDDYSSLWPLVR